MRRHILILLGVCLGFTSLVFADAGQELDFIKKTVQQGEKKLNDYLVEELTQFVNTYQDSTIGADGALLLGTVYRNMGKEHVALAVFYKTLFLYPEFEQRYACIENARYLATTEKAYKEKQNLMLTVLNNTMSDSAKVDRAFNFIKFLVDVDEKDLYEQAIKESRWFLQEFGQDTRIDTVQLWLGKFYEKNKDELQAANAYSKIPALYPDSPLTPTATFYYGTLLYKELKEYPKAVDVFNKIVTDFPDNENAAASLFMMGELYEKELKNYIKAIETYRQLVDTYPEYTDSFNALLSIAELYTKRLDQHAEAIAAYDEFVEKYPSHPNSVEALKDAGKIYEKELKDYIMAAQYYAKVAELYPDHDDAPGLLVDAGQLCTDRLNNYDQAIEYFQKVIDNYPQHKKADEANKRLKKALEDKNRGSN